MAKGDEIREILQSIVKVPKQTFQGTIKKVDETLGTCSVAISETVIFSGVRLRAVVDEGDGVYLVPKIESKVLVSRIFNSSELFVSKISEFDKILVKTGNFNLTLDLTGEKSLILTYGESKILLQDGEISFNEGQNGGLIKVNDLVTKLNNLESDINNLKTALSTWTPISQDGGAALKAVIATWSGQNLTPTQKTDIENDKVKH